MAKVKVNTDLGNIKDVETLSRFVSIALKDIVEQINGGVEFDTNFRSKTLVVDFTQADTEVAVRHNLSRTPVGYLQAGSNAATSLYNSRDPDSNYLYLKSSAVALVQVVVF